MYNLNVCAWCVSVIFYLCDLCISVYNTHVYACVFICLCVCVYIYIHITYVYTYNIYKRYKCVCCVIYLCLCVSNGRVWDHKANLKAGFSDIQLLKQTMKSEPTSLPRPQKQNKTQFLVTFSTRLALSLAVCSPWFWLHFNFGGISLSAGHEDSMNQDLMAPGWVVSLGGLPLGGLPLPTPGLHLPWLFCLFPWSPKSVGIFQEMASHCSFHKMGRTENL